MAVKGSKNKKLVIAVVCCVLAIVLVVAVVSVSGAHVTNTNVTYQDAVTLTPPKAELSVLEVQKTKECNGHKLVAANDNY